MMKKTIRILICILALLTVTTVFVAAKEPNRQYVYHVDDNEYTVEFMDAALTAEQQEQVAYRLVHSEDSDTHTYGLGCILFGHDLKTSKVGVITHKVYKYAPRCKQEIYDVTICEDCDYQTQTLSSTSYINCCPED